MADSRARWIVAKIRGLMTDWKRVSSVLGGATLLVLGCTLYSDVTVYPLFLTPTSNRPLASLVNLVEAGDYGLAVSLAPSIDGKEGKRFEELAALGRAEVAAGRFAAARKHLELARSLRPSRPRAAEIAWDLSQADYLENRYADSARWARQSMDYGMVVKQWHLNYLDAMAKVGDVYQMEGQARDVLLAFGNPDIPRIDAVLNGSKRVSAAIDSGAVLTIVSETLARESEILPLEAVEGTFFGLLGEPIRVTFGIVRTLQIGELMIRNVPVAVMPDSKLSFLVSNRKPFKLDLLLGANLLKEFRLELDFDDHKATLTPLVPGGSRPREDQNLFYVGFRPVVQSTINRKGWFLFLLDTGSEITFLNQSTLQATSVRNSTRLHGATLQGLGGSKKHGQKIANIEIGIAGWAANFRTLPLYSNESEAFGIIGQNFLRHFRVIVDFGSMRLDLLQK